MAGWLIHLSGSAAIGVVYAWIFQLLRINDDLWLWGLVGGFIHWFIAGVVMAAIPLIHPLVPQQMPAPGSFVRSLGGHEVIVFLIGHVGFGMLFALLYAALHG